MRMNLMAAPDIRKAAPRAVVLLPLGSTEQHGPHLGVSTDSTLVTAVAEGVEGAVPDDVLLCPTLAVGSSHHHLGFGALSIAPETYARAVADLIDCLQRWDAPRILILNGHGGNIVPAKQALNELAARDNLKSLVAFTSYWELDAAFTGKPPMESARLSHACEYETSMMLHVLPEAVNLKKARRAKHPPGNAYIDWDKEPYRGVSTGMPFHQITSIGNCGQPDKGTPKKGAYLVGAAVKAVTALVQSFKTWPLPEDMRE